jgi:hypothetical protein
MIISRSILLRMISVQTKVVGRHQNTHFMFYTFFFENLFACEMMWKNIVHPDRPQITIWRTRIACRISKITVTHLEYVIITAFPLQQLLHQRASVLRYTYIAYLVPLSFHISVQLPFKQLWSRLLLCHYETLERCASIRYRRRCCQHQRDLYRSFLLVGTVLICLAWETLLVAQLPPA